MEIRSEAIRVLYHLHESSVKTLQEGGFSYEDAFWIDFATTALMDWDDAGETKIRLSEIFRLYLTIYCEKIDRSIKFEDEPAFFDKLAEKYYLVKEIVRRGGDTGRMLLLLGFAVLGEKGINPWLGMKAASCIIYAANEAYDSCSSMGIKLVIDIRQSEKMIMRNIETLQKRYLKQLKNPDDRQEDID